ncbi:MAG: 50S ribosomal protein L1, partial [Candidatus Marinimicrobia bacterium]|nr:50S ribosomal protein L1 [Candidatus Neomarinimicrobiota bacterium]
MAHSKRYKQNLATIDRTIEYSLDDAVNMLKDQQAATFDESVEISINLGIDPKH